jgi:hypothetical protein
VDDAAHHARPARVHHPARVLSRHPGVVTEHGRGVVHVGACLVQRLTGVQALGLRQLLAVSLQQVGDLAEQRGAVRQRGPAPRAFVEGLPGGRDRRVHVGRAGLGQGVQDGRVVRIDGL